MGRAQEATPVAKRPTLLLLSGLICDQTIWQEITLDLAPIADLRLMSFAGYDSIKAMAQGVLKAASAQFSLAGHSMGGRVALEIMRLAPSRVERLALLNTGARAAEDSETQTRMRLVAIAREQGMTALAEQWLPPMMGAPPERVAVVTPRLVRMAKRATPDTFAAQVRALLDRPDQRDVLDTIRIPTLLVSGAEDHWSPLAQHVEMHERIAQSTLVTIPEAGHMAPVEQPAAVAAALKAWLAA